MVSGVGLPAVRLAMAGLAGMTTRQRSFMREPGQSCAQP